MESLTVRQLIYVRGPRMVRPRSISAPPLRSVTPVAIPRLRRRTRVRAEFGNARVPDNVLPQVAGDNSVASHPVEQQALFVDIVDQTVYVEKGAAVQSVPPSEMIRHAEVVPDSPSFSLVRTYRQPDNISETKRIFGEVVIIP